MNATIFLWTAVLLAGTMTESEIKTSWKEACRARGGVLVTINAQVPTELYGVQPALFGICKIPDGGTGKPARPGLDSEGSPEKSARPADKPVFRPIEKVT